MFKKLGRRHVPVLIAVFVLGMVSAASGLVIPIVIGQLVDAVQEGTATVATIWWTGGLMFAAAMVGALGTAATTVLAGQVYNTVLAELREDVVAEITKAVPVVIPVFTSVAFGIITTVVGMVSLDWRYGVALLVLIPLYVLSLRWYLGVGPRVYRAERTAMSGRAQQIMESQRGYPTVVGLDLAAVRQQKVLDTSWGGGRSQSEGTHRGQHVLRPTAFRGVPRPVGDPARGVLPHRRGNLHGGCGDLGDAAGDPPVRPGQPAEAGLRRPAVRTDLAGPDGGGDAHPGRR